MRCNAIGFFLACGLFAATAFAQDKPGAPTGAEASAEDCAVLAEAGKVQLNWGAAPPSDMMWRGSFGANCDWPSLGLAPPQLSPVDSGQYYDGLRFAFSPPVYSGGGLQAMVDISVGGSSAPAHYFYTGYRCTVTKRAGHWQGAVCTMRYIT
jgi:hypothetical protein